MVSEENKIKCIRLVEAQNIDQLDIFSAKNPDMNFDFTDNNGNNLLHIAVKNQSEKTQETLRWLLCAKVDIDGVNKNFETPLDVAISHKNIPAISYLKMVKENGKI